MGWVHAINWVGVGFLIILLLFTLGIGAARLYFWRRRVVRARGVLTRRQHRKLRRIHRRLVSTARAWDRLSQQEEQAYKEMFGKKEG